MDKLTSGRRNALPDRDFAGPDRSYPIDTENRGRNALSRVSEFGTGEVKAQVRRAVHRKYPDLAKHEGK